MGPQRQADAAAVAAVRELEQKLCYHVKAPSRRRRSSNVARRLGPSPPAKLTVPHLYAGAVLEVLHGDPSARNGHLRRRWRYVGSGIIRDEDVVTRR
jgi:hypothetical protein